MVSLPQETLDFGLCFGWASRTLLTGIVVDSDIGLMMTVSFILIFTCTVFFKEFKLLSFDPGFAKGIGLPVVFLDYFIMMLIVAMVQTLLCLIVLCGIELGLAVIGRSASFLHKYTSRHLSPFVCLKRS